MAALSVFVYMVSTIIWYIARLLAHVLFRITVIGEEHIPGCGPAILFFNHVSFVDPIIRAAAVPRPMTYLMWHGYRPRRFAKMLTNVCRVIPVGSDAGPSITLSSFRQAINVLRSGEIVGISPEGRVSALGFLLPFRRGIEVLSRAATEAPVIPGYIDGVIASPWSNHTRLRSSWRRKAITVRFGPPIKRPVTRRVCRHAMQELALMAYEDAAASPFASMKYVRYWMRRYATKKALYIGRGKAVAGFTIAVMTISAARRLRNMSMQHGSSIRSCHNTYIKLLVTSLATNILGKRHIIAHINDCPRHTCGEADAATDAGVSIGTANTWIAATWRDVVITLLWLYGPMRISRFILGRPNKCSRKCSVRGDVIACDWNRPTLLETVANARALRDTLSIRPGSAIGGRVCATDRFWQTWFVHAALIGMSVIDLSGRYRPRMGTVVFVGDSWRPTNEGHARGMESSRDDSSCYRQWLVDDVNATLRNSVGSNPAPISSRVLFRCKSDSVILCASREGFFSQIGEKPGSIGHPLPGVLIVATCRKSGDVLDAGGIGRLIYRFPFRTEMSFDRSGGTSKWRRIEWEFGSVNGYLDDDGFVFLSRE